MSIPARTRWLMLAAVGALTVVACGGDDKDTANTSAPDGTDAATTVAVTLWALVFFVSGDLTFGGLRKAALDTASDEEPRVK